MSASRALHVVVTGDGNVTVVMVCHISGSSHLGYRPYDNLIQIMYGIHRSDPQVLEISESILGFGLIRGKRVTRSRRCLIRGYFLAGDLSQPADHPHSCRALIPGLETRISSPSCCHCQLAIADAGAAGAASGSAVARCCCGDHSGRCRWR